MFFSSSLLISCPGAKILNFGGNYVYYENGEARILFGNPVDVIICIIILHSRSSGDFC